VSEWPIEHAWKACLPQGNEGSNPSLSALSSEASAKEDHQKFHLAHMQFVYILKCADQTHYTGCTEDLDARLKRHQSGYVEYTKTRLPVELIYYCAFEQKDMAFEFEKYLKTGSGIAFRNKRLVAKPSFATAFVETSAVKKDTEGK
jgi:putative endonuclease